MNSENEENQQTTTIPFYLVGKNADIKIYNIRCHLCRNIGLKVFQLDNDATSTILPTPDELNKSHLKHGAGKKILVPKQGVNTKNKSLTALKHANLLLRRQ